MTPKEIAVELVDKFKKIQVDGDVELYTHFNLAKKSALIAVDEIFYYNSKESMNDYWIEVKQEIEKL